MIGRLTQVTVGLTAVFMSCWAGELIARRGYGFDLSEGVAVAGIFLCMTVAGAMLELLIKTNVSEEYRPPVERETRNRHTRSVGWGRPSGVVNNREEVNDER